MADQELRLAKYLTAGVAFLLVVLGGGVWPLIWWGMYSSGDRAPKPQVKRFELRVQDINGQEYILRPMDLYTLDDDSSSQAAGHRLVKRSAIGTEAQKAVYRPYLMRRLEFLLDTPIQEVEAWQNIWNVDYSQHPPIAIEQPAETVFVDRFNADSFDSARSR
ncbi:MAG: hypothetical protein AAF821_20660 [Cyanobacteria bacterium P01_D01_bin.156]